MKPTQSWPNHTYILIPAYKSVDPLGRFLQKLLLAAPKEKICIVDDGSRDGTEQLCRKMGLEYIAHNNNMGKGAALVSGFDFLINKKGAQWIISMDADGQHSPDDLHLFIDSIGKYPNAGIIIGAREMKPGVMPLARICSNKLTSGFLSLITSNKILDSQSGYRLYSAEMLKVVSLQFRRFEMETEVILKAISAGFQVCFVQVHTLYLKDNSSHISHVFDTLRWIKAVISVWFSLRKK